MFFFFYLYLCQRLILKIFYTKRKTSKGVVATMVVALLAGYRLSKSVNNSSTELSELTLANVEALAENESGGDDLGCGSYNFDNHILKLKDCFPFFWLQKLKCKPMMGKCCNAESQKSCSGQNPGIDFSFIK